MKRFNKNILFIGLSEKACPFSFFCHGKSSLHKMLIFIPTLILLSWLVHANKLSAWTARLYVEDKDLGITSVLIGVASKAHQKVREHEPDPNSVILVLYKDKIPLLEDIRKEGNAQYIWTIWIDPTKNIVPLDLSLTATIIWDFSSLSVYDLKDPTGFMVKLRHASDPISLFLRDQFYLTNPQLLISAYDESGPPPESLQVALINGLNELIRGPSIYDKERFAKITLSQNAQRLITQNPQGEELKCLNRLLLDEAYPQEIAKSSKFKPGTYELLLGSGKALKVVVADMKTTESYIVKGIQEYLTLVFTESDNDKDETPATTHFEDNVDGGCFIATCALQ